MAKNRLFLHAGSQPSALTHADLTRHRSLLAGAGCLVPDIAPNDLDASATEMLHDHRSRGMTRREVEGAWAGITRGLWRLGTDVAISQPRFEEADLGQFALLLDHLAGLEVHVALLHSSAPTAVPPWATLLPPTRLHVRELEDDARPIDLAETLTGVVWSVRRADEQERTFPLRALSQRRRTTPAA